MKNITSYTEFMNEAKANPKKGFMISKKVQDSIKSCCEGMMAEAKECHENEDPKQTYEGYVNEAMNYLKECMGSY